MRKKELVNFPEKLQAWKSHGHARGIRKKVVTDATLQTQSRTLSSFVSASSSSNVNHWHKYRQFRSLVSFFYSSFGFFSSSSWWFPPMCRGVLVYISENGFFFSSLLVQQSQWQQHTAFFIRTNRCWLPLLCSFSLSLYASLFFLLCSILRQTNDDGVVFYGWEEHWNVAEGKQWQVVGKRQNEATERMRSGKKDEREMFSILAIFARSTRARVALPKADARWAHVHVDSIIVLHTAIKLKLKRCVISPLCAKSQTFVGGVRVVDWLSATHFPLVKSFRHQKYHIFFDKKNRSTTKTKHFHRRVAHTQVLFSRRVDFLCDYISPYTI